ncbi:hypothetical protein [Brevibacillus porteri]|uniref:hypothetical protein n=1 Tax=Brevibacillus porteri TaxID=2126350 RepID=UPI003D2479EC
MATVLSGENPLWTVVFYFSSGRGGEKNIFSLRSGLRPAWMWGLSASKRFAGKRKSGSRYAV